MRLPVLLLLSILIGCKGEPLEWGDPVFTNRPAAPQEPAVSTPIPDSARCLASLTTAAVGPALYAAWWRVQHDSSALLMVSRSATTKGDWSSPVVADSTDHSVRGCNRPAPSIAVDSASGYVHVAYFLEPSAGAGVFFAHSMDSALTFHAPVPIVFGRNPSRVSVATNGDRVVVAYEDPNAQESSIGVALSRTMGHLFESRMQATPDHGNAISPTVRLDGDSIRVWWTESSHDPFGGTTRPAYRAARWN